MDALTVLLTEQEIKDKVSELARRISHDYGDTPLLLVGVLKGSFVFLADLARQLGPNAEIDFVQTSSYGEGTSTSGVVQIRKDLDVNIEERDVLIVEDILDTGKTLTHLRELLSTRRPRSLKVVTLLCKPGVAAHGTQAEYVGFMIPDRFVVGYGLDHAERHRNLPFVAVLNQEV